MTAKETALAVGALALAGVIGVGVDEVLDDAAKVERAEKVALELKAPTYAEKDVPAKLKTEAFESTIVSFDGGAAFVAPAVEEDGGKAYVVLDESPCVIPDCSADDGKSGAAWDDNHTEVDCVFEYPGEAKRWRGCNVGARIYASGAACLPSACLESAR